MSVFTKVSTLLEIEACLYHLCDGPGFHGIFQLTVCIAFRYMEPGIWLNK